MSSRAAGPHLPVLTSVYLPRLQSHKVNPATLDRNNAGLYEYCLNTSALGGSPLDFPALGRASVSISREFANLRWN
jgi:hypothetical protein